MAERERADQQSWEGEMFRLLVENVKDYAIFVVDPEGRVLSWSPGAERLLGYREEEVVGQDFSIIFTPEDIRQGQPDQELRNAKEIGRAEDEHWHVRKNGERFWALGIITPSHDASGKHTGYSKILRDMTDRKRAEEEARFQARLLDTVGQAVVVTDPEGRIIFWNRSAETVYGWSRGEALGRNILEMVVAQEGAERAAEIMGRLRAGESWSGEFLVRRRDGTTFAALVTDTPVFDDQGRLQALIGISTDMTDRKRLEEQLRQRVEELAQADRLKDEFLAMLAHELRNPLAPIRNGLHIMKQPGVSGEVIEQVRAMMERQAQHMARLLDDLLDVSRISRGRIELHKEPVDLLPLVNRTVETVRPLAEERRHQLTVSLAPQPLWVEGDPTRLEQVVTNLLNNACKYTDPGGHIWLTAERENGEVVLRVRDTGIGIAPNMLPHIFDLFVQAERRLDRSQGGVGIGLTLVKRLVELHGGTVGVRSEGPGKGSEFIIRLPTLSDQPTGERKEPKGANIAPAAVPSRRILVVDDNQDAADSLGLLLRLAGQDVRVAYDGSSALTLAGEFRPAIAFLDIGMPGMDGFEVARRCREQPGSKDVLLVALTGWAQEEDRRRCYEAGFDGHLAKPLEWDALRQFLAHPKLLRHPASGS